MSTLRNHVRGEHAAVSCKLCRLFERLDWLRAAGCCSACAYGLALRSRTHPELMLPCGQPPWHRGKCVERARAAEAARVAERKAA